MWQKCGGNVAEMWRKNLWQKRNNLFVAEMWPKCGGNVAELWQKNCGGFDLTSKCGRKKMICGGMWRKME